MQLTASEKRKFLEKTDELVKFDVLSREDVDSIYSIYRHALEREMFGDKEERE